MKNLTNSLRFRKLLPLLFLPLFILISCSKDEDDPDNFNKDRSLNKKSLGYSAHDLLSADKYKSVIVEVQYVQGFEPTQAALNNLKTFMEQRLNKPEGITFKMKQIPAGGKTAYTITDIKKIEDQYREEFTKPNQLAIYFFFADGDYAQNSGGGKVLGQAHRNTSMVLYQKTIQELSGGLTQPPRATLETVILEHELGHILGLVNVGTEMVTNHQDAAHGAHCTNTNCLMYWGVETGDVVQKLLGGNMPQLDQNCLNDLRNNGGK
jgi:predicted Zn-dependent protease